MGLEVRLPELFTGIDVRLPPRAEEVDVRALAVDSRKVGAGALFAALPGAVADGADFAPQAVERGAAAVLSDRELDVAPAALIVAPDARRAFSQAASRFHGEPSKRMRLVGVTGTNGKTTTAYLVEQLAAARGLRTGLIGTVESRWPGGREGAIHTTPESHDLQELLARMAQAGAQLVAMEVSSHALAQERVSGCTFAAAAFTNLTRDHLDYHGTLEAYFEAKARLFRELLPAGAPPVRASRPEACRATWKGSASICAADSARRGSRAPWSARTTRRTCSRRSACSSGSACRSWSWRRRRRRRAELRGGWSACPIRAAGSCWSTTRTRTTRSRACSTPSARPPGARRA